MNRVILFSIYLWMFYGLLGTPAWAVGEKTAEEQIERLSTRIEELDKRLEKRAPLTDWIDNITITGLLEAEAGYTKFDPAAAGEPDEEASDIVFSTMEIGFDAAFSPHISGHLLFLWEEDETEPVDLDEGFISVYGGDLCPIHVNAGKFYLPFGHFESFFITDPLTLELGETNESAVLLGYRASLFDMGAGVFNGDINEIGADDHINNFFGYAAVALPEGFFPGIELTSGVSYISNIADSDLLSAEITSEDGIQNLVSGISAYVSASFYNRVFFMAEYTGALDDFTDGEFDFADGPVKPKTWNTELAYVFASECGFGIKYEGADDGGALLPETRFGAIAFCQPFTRTYLGIEYLWEEFETDDDTQSATVQLAYQF